jgi:hypothetical protein
VRKQIFKKGDGNMGKIIRINEITDKDRRELENIDKKCLAMHVCPPPKTFINMKVHQGGELVLDYDMRSKSWVRNMYNYMAMNAMCMNASTGGSSFGAGYMAIKGSALYSVGPYYNGAIPRAAGGTYYGSQAGTILGGDGQAYFGIQVGTDNTAESFESSDLGAYVVNGTGSGQMSYAAMEAPTPSYNSGDKKWSVVYTRIMNNNSGDTINVNECGIFCLWLYGSSQSYSSFLVCRDVLVSPVAVADTAQLTVTYTIEMTFPA